jgi:hypothetical protein
VGRARAEIDRGFGPGPPQASGGLPSPTRTAVTGGIERGVASGPLPLRGWAERPSHRRSRRPAAAPPSGFSAPLISEFYPISGFADI